MKHFIFTTMLLALASMTFGQTVAIDGVRGYKFNGVFPIMSGEDGETSGYYTYYLKDREEKGMRTVEFAIIDKQATKAEYVPVSMHKNSTINNTVYNGETFLISYDDRKNKKVVINTITLDGKIKAKREIPTEKRRLAASTVYPAAEGSGFFIVRPVKEKKKKGYTIEKVDNDLKSLWKIEDVVEKGIIQVADLINTKDRFVIWREHGLSIKKLKPQIVCYNSSTGKEIFSKSGYDGASTILYNQLRIDTDGGILAGGAYVDGEKYRSVNNTGIYMLKLDNAGKDVFYTKVSNKEKIQAALKGAASGFSVGSKDKVWIEDLIVNDGEIIVVSEMFRKNMNMTPKAVQKTRDLITGKWIGDIAYVDQNGKSPKVTFEIMDYILFKFDESGKMTEIKSIPKTHHNKLTVYHPYVGLYGMPMAKVVERKGWFDYGFTSTDAAGTKIMVCSNNAEARKPQVFTYGFDSKNTKSELNLKNDSSIDLEKGKVSYFKPLQNGEGKIGVAYYQRKLKRITINIETL